MKSCPRCRSSVLLTTESVPGSSRPVWKCIGCGQEVLLDSADRDHDQQLLEGINSARQRSLTGTTKLEPRYQGLRNVLRRYDRHQP